MGRNPGAGSDATRVDLAYNSIKAGIVEGRYPPGAPLSEVMLARETASLQFQLAVQVRNKLVEAYQDVMRMQI